MTYSALDDEIFEARRAGWNAALESAAKLCSTEAGDCLGDIVEHDELGAKLAKARAAALLTAADDIRALKSPEPKASEGGGDAG